jgi:hypothetical protein
VTTQTASAADFRSSRAAFETAAAASRLSLLDDLWTSSVEVVDLQSQADRDSLRELVHDMQELLFQVRNAALGLHEQVRQLGEERVDAMLDAILDVAPNGERLRADLAETIGAQPFSAALLAACVHIAEHGSEEAESLQTQLDALLAGGSAPGDFKLRFKCALGLLIGGAAVVGSTVLGVMAGLPVAAPLLGGLAGAAVGVAAGVGVAAPFCQGGAAATLAST